MRNTVRGGVPTEEDYRTFQDYIFRVLIDQAGKLNLPGAFSQRRRHRRLF